MLTSDIKCVIAFFSKRHDLGEKLRLKLRTLSVYCSEALVGDIVDIFLTVEFCNILSSFLCGSHISVSIFAPHCSFWVIFWLILLIISAWSHYSTRKQGQQSAGPECSSITVVNTQSLYSFSWADGQHGTLQQLYVNFTVQYICVKREFVFCYLAIKESIFCIVFFCIFWLSDFKCNILWSSGKGQARKGKERQERRKVKGLKA